MYPTSATYQEKIKELERVFQIKIQIQHSKGVLELGDRDLVGGTLTYSESSQPGDDFTVGGVVASTIDFEILNKQEYASINFMGATVLVSVGLMLIQGMNLTYEDLKSYTYEELKNYLYGQLGATRYEYIPLGIFNIDDVGKQRNTIQIKAMDNMINLDLPYSLSQLSYPATLYQIYANICNVADVPIGTIDFLNKGYLVQEKPDGDFTFRDILGYVAELSGSFAKFNRLGALELAWYSESGLTINPSNRFDFIPRDDLIQIKGVMATVDDTTYLAGADDYAVDLSDNPLLQGGYETILPAIFDKIKNTAFYPFKSSWQGNPAIQAGDIITQIDRDGKHWPTLVTSSTFKYRGASTLSGNGQPLSAKGYKGSTNKKITNIVRKEIKPIGDQLTTLEQAQLNATQLIANMLGGYAIQTPDAFYVADNPNIDEAIKVWKWGLGGFGYSSTGKVGPYTTAITANGSIVAMLVAAGIVTADMVQTGLLQSEDGGTWINLDNGWFNFKNVLKWDGTAIQMLDDLNVERMRLGNYADGKYGLLLKDKTGQNTILDEDGILQTWQEGRADNVDDGSPLVLNIYLPPETKSIRSALLRFRLQQFRTYSTGAASGGGRAVTSGSKRGTVETFGQNGGVDFWTDVDAYRWLQGSQDQTMGAGGHKHTDKNQPHDHLTGYPYYSNISTVEDHTHGVYNHGHRITISSHTHNLVLGSHDHTVEVPDHEHDINYGIYTSTLPLNTTIKINSIDRTASLGGPFNADQSSLNIASFLQVGQWNTIEIGSSRLGRVDATVFIQSLMGV